MAERIVTDNLATRLLPNATQPKNVAIPRARPGVVIFLHGVNDPGASYASVETGLCQGLNERLDRQDLKPGRYGERFWVAKSKDRRTRSKEDAETLDDPDTNLYKRNDAHAKSVLIPFYWGYRAAKNEILRDENGDPAKVRTQYQDKNGNRLDRHFGKPGGFFANATNNLPEMYGKGYDSIKRHAANATFDNTKFMGIGPHRRYFVLAAERLAALITTIRSIYPSETITIMGHSQGTLITLLSQALLIDRGERCADCAIMVASPYSLIAERTRLGGDTLHTLQRIVERMTKTPYVLPSLDDLAAGQPKSYGRAGPRWSSGQGQRLGKSGSTVVFPERDNRGKVYLYFSPDDTTVGLADVSGIGTLGVPDLVDGGRPGMTRLTKIGFKQRMWTKRHRHGKPVMIGDAPTYHALRAKGEPRYAGGVSLGTVAAAIAMTEGSQVLINGEALVPPHAPQMFGGEAVKGTPTTSGMDRPDAVSTQLALGKSDADFPFLPLPKALHKLSDKAAKDRFNEGKEDGDKTHAVRSAGWGKGKEREMTPNEIGDWMSRSDEVLDENSYHSGVLRDPENHRWVTAMDVAIGQGHSLDDPQWRELLTLMADWRMTEEMTEKMKDNPKWTALDPLVQKLVQASGKYYLTGEFPPASLVNLKKLPSLVDGHIPEGG